MSERMISLEWRCDPSTPEREAIERLARTHQTLEDVTRWGFSQSPPRLIDEVVTQDEFSLDVLVPSDRLWLVYDATCLGGLRGLSVWDRRPTGEELLERRLVDGWRPTPSPTRGGDRVLGLAGRAA